MLKNTKYREYLDFEFLICFQFRISDLVAAVRPR